MLELPSKKLAAFRQSLRHTAVYETNRIVAPKHAKLLQVYIKTLRPVHRIVTRESFGVGDFDEAVFK